MFAKHSSAMITLNGSIVAFIFLVLFIIHVSLQVGHIRRAATGCIDLANSPPT